jgi:hypothetical protein
LNQARSDVEAARIADEAHGWNVHVTSKRPDIRLYPLESVQSITVPGLLHL